MKNSKNDSTIRTPKEWEVIDGITIIDHDGWRHEGKSIEEPIARREWNTRLIQSTCNVVKLANLIK